MEKKDEDIERVVGGHQPKSEEFGHQPNDSTIIKGYQPKPVESKPEGKTPPSGGSNVSPPKKSD